jgi:hypothetical protein
MPKSPSPGPKCAPELANAPNSVAVPNLGNAQLFESRHWIPASIRTAEMALVLGAIYAAVSVGGDMTYVIPLLLVALAVSVIGITTY